MTTPNPNLIVHHLQTGQGERIPFLLEELSLPYTLKLYQRSPFFSPPELKALHPMGASPVLEDLTDPSSPILLAESGAIVEYILTKYGSGRLSLPPTHPNYAEYLYWLHFANGNMQPTIFRRFTVKSLVPSLDDPRYKTANDRVQRCLSHFNSRVTSNTWLAGETFTAADVMSMWCLSTMRQFEAIDLSEYAGIVGWLKRVAAREGYQTAMKKADPDIDIEAGISVEGPGVFGAFLAMRKGAGGAEKKEKL